MSELGEPCIVVRAHEPDRHKGNERELCQTEFQVSSLECQVTNYQFDLSSRARRQAGEGICCLLLRGTACLTKPSTTGSKKLPFLAAAMASIPTHSDCTLLYRFRRLTFLPRDCILRRPGARQHRDNRTDQQQVHSNPNPHYQRIHMRLDNRLAGVGVASGIDDIQIFV